MAIEIKQLSQRILKLRRDIVENANELTKQAARTFIEDVIDSAPVDTGLTVSSWKVGLNYRPSGTRLFSPGKLGSTAEANRRAVKAVVLERINQRVTGQTISFANDTPYVQYINDGDYKRYIESAMARAMDSVKQRKLF